MGLPIITSIQDCADYHKTVEPFLPQLYELPNRLLENGFDIEGLKRIYIDTNPLMSGFAMSIFLGGIFLIVSEVNRNYSQVDRMWSILPNLYVVHIALWARLAGLAHSRLDLAAAATTIWSVCIQIYPLNHMLFPNNFHSDSSYLQLLPQGGLLSWL